jgi:hypothetical protein
MRFGRSVATRNHTLSRNAGGSRKGRGIEMVVEEDDGKRVSRIETKGLGTEYGLAVGGGSCDGFKKNGGSACVWHWAPQLDWQH